MLTSPQSFTKEHDQIAIAPGSSTKSSGQNLKSNDRTSDTRENAVPQEREHRSEVADDTANYRVPDAEIQFRGQELEEEADVDDYFGEFKTKQAKKKAEIKDKMSKA
jgi:hypothetical protein